MAEWQRRFWATAATGYLAIGLRMLTGLVMFRLMFETFTRAEFGFWALLWSIFGYGILLDFGFGFTAQKAVAANRSNSDPTALSRLLATILWSFVALAAILWVLFVSFRDPLLDRMAVSAANRDGFEAAYLVFFAGLAVMFPLGVFPELLRGLQRVDIANWLSVIATVLQFGFLYWGLTSGWCLAALMGVSIGATVLPNLIAAVVVFKKLPGLSLSPRWFDWRQLRGQLSFSITAYLITFSNLLMGKSDQIVISMTLGVSLVAIYQAGYKISEMLGIFSSQLQQILSPAAAAMHASGDHSGIQRLLTASSKFTFFAITPCYLLSAVYLEPLIHLLTGLDPIPRETYWVGQTLLLTIYVSQLTSGCSKRVLMMSGQERTLLRISLTEAASNLALSLILVWKFGILGVALGTAIPATVIGCLWIVPFTTRCLGIRWTTYLKNHLQGTTAPLLSFGIILTALLIWAPAKPDSNLLDLGWRGLACIAPLILFGRGVIREITTNP